MHFNSQDGSLCDKNEVVQVFVFTPASEKTACRKYFVIKNI